MNCVYRHAKTALLSVFLSVFLMMGAAVPENIVPEGLVPGGFLSEGLVPEKLVPEGFLPADCGTVYAAMPTSYSYLTNAFKARVPYAESRTDDRGRSLSKLVDCGDHYELTNVNLYAYKKYDAAEVENLSVGERYTVEGKAYKLKEIKENGERVLERKDAFDTEYAYLIPVNPGRNKKGYYISVKHSLSDGSRDSSDLYYTGTIYLRKDCVMESLGLQEDGSRASVDAGTYFTTDRKSLLPEGLFSYGYDAAEDLLSVCGSITLDSEGYVISYTEKY